MTLSGLTLHVPGATLLINPMKLSCRTLMLYQIKNELNSKILLK